MTSNYYNRYQTRLPATVGKIAEGEHAPRARDQKIQAGATRQYGGNYRGTAEGDQFLQRAAQGSIRALTYATAYYGVTHNVDAEAEKKPTPPRPNWDVHRTPHGEQTAIGAGPRALGPGPRVHTQGPPTRTGEPVGNTFYTKAHRALGPGPSPEFEGVSEDLRDAANLSVVGGKTVSMNRGPVPYDRRPNPSRGTRRGTGAYIRPGLLDWPATHSVGW